MINRNSSQRVTDGLDAAIHPLRSFGTPIRCLTLVDKPPGIESQRQADLTIALMLALADAQNDAAGFVIACFGDPGLHALRDQTYLAVIGIQEAAVITALTLGQRFGVIAILPPSIRAICGLLARWVCSTAWRGIVPLALVQRILQSPTKALRP